MSIRWSEGSCEGNYALPARRKAVAYDHVAMNCKMAGR